MEVKVSAKTLRISPKKLRSVVDLARGKKLAEILPQLQFAPAKSARLLIKILKSGVAAAKEKDANLDQLFIKKIILNQGLFLKRQRILSRGRASIIRRPTSHIELVLSDEVKEETGKKIKKSKQGKAENPKSQAPSSKQTPKSKYQKFKI